MEDLKGRIKLLSTSNHRHDYVEGIWKEKQTLLLLQPITNASGPVIYKRNFVQKKLMRKVCHKRTRQLVWKGKYKKEWQSKAGDTVEIV